MRWYDSAKGRVFYILFRRAGKLVWERVGTDREGYSGQVAAELRGERIRANRHPELAPPPPAPRFGTLAAEYLKWAQSAKGSAKHDEQRWRLHLKPVLEERSCGEIGRLEVERLAGALREKGLSPATVRRVIALFRAIWNKGLEWRLVALANPASRLKLPAEENERERFLSPAELEQFVQELRPGSPRCAALTVLGYHTGARVGELLGLVWADVDLEHRAVVFRKTKASRTRRVPLNRSATACFEGMRPDPKKPPPPAALVFPSTHTGEEIRTISDAFYDAVDRLFNGG